jgi:hypothetical protein
MYIRNLPPYPLKPSQSQTYDELLDQAGYDEVDPEIRAQFRGKRLPTLKFRSGYLVHFAQACHSVVVLADMTTLGLRPAHLEELLIFTIRYPEVHRGRSIVALGTDLKSGDQIHFPCIYRMDGKRILALVPAANEIDWWWNRHFGFLAVN